jgi:hypothetical protein
VTLRVTPTALYSLSLAPSTVCGCKNTIGRVTLTGPAPAGGVTVSLSDTHSNAAVPPSVLVPAGATTAQFTITTTPVAAITNGLVTATYAGVTKSATLSVRPIGVAALALSPEVVLGPSPVTATVTLECAAGPSPITVSLSSTNPAVANPAVPAITIPVSSITGTFRVNTVDVSVSSSAIIRATANGLTGSRGMVVN